MQPHTQIKKHLALAMLVTALALGSCTSYESERRHESHTANAISLNQGEKWKVNSEMTPHILQGQALLEEYTEGENHDYLTLATELKAHNEALIQSCTMKGESHDQLHKWLHPHLQLTEELGQATDHEEAAEIVVKLEESFALYSSYFE